MSKNRTVVSLLLPTTALLAAATSLTAQREPVKDPKSLGIPAKYLNWKGPVQSAGNGAGVRKSNRPVIMLTGYWPPTNEMVRRFSTDAVKNPSGWIGSNWENRGYDVHSFFPEFPSGSWPRGRGDFEVDYQDTSADWARITAAMKPIAIITHSRGGSTGNWEYEMNAQNHGRWVNDSLAPFQPNPSPPDGSLPAGTPRRLTHPVLPMIAATNNAGLGLRVWSDDRGNGGTYLSEYMSYHGVWYKNTHSDRKKPDWCITGGHIHVGQDSIAKLQQAVFANLRALTTYLDRVRSGEAQQNLGYGTRGPAVATLGGGPLRAGSYSRLRLQRLRPGATTLLVLSNQAMPTLYRGSVYLTNPATAVYPFVADARGMVEIPGITGGGGAMTLYLQFGYADGSLLGISNALEANFLN